jgi:HK97 family phage portal protein
MLGRLTEKRGAFQELWGSGALFERPSAAGVRVDQDTSLRLTAVYACVRLIADTISTLPLGQFVRRDSERLPYSPADGWVTRPSMIVDRSTFYQQVVVSLLLDGNAYLAITRDSGGNVVDLNVLNPTEVEPKMGPTGPYYVLQSTNRRLQRDDVLHLTEMLLPGAVKGVSRIEKAKDALGLGLALEEYAGRFFGNGAYAGGVIEWPGTLTVEQQAQLRDAWDGHHRGVSRSHRPGVLWGGAKFTTTTVSPSDSQLIEERRFAVEEVARVFRVPPFMLGVTTAGSMSYSSVEQQMLFFSQHTIQPYVARIENGLNTLVSNPQSFVKFNLSSLVRADLATRYAGYSSSLLAGWHSVNDVRTLEDLPPVEGGDQYRVPVQNLPLTDAPIATVTEKAKAAQALVMAGFTGESVARLLDLDATHSGTISVQQQPEVQE